jgi:hypothetical protein
VTRANAEVNQATKDVIMHRNAMMATVAIGLAAAATVACMATMTAAVAAPGASGGPARTGLFATWRSAQAAAGFRLLRPTKTYGLPSAGKISVARCDITRKRAKAGKHLVIAGYGRTVKANLTLSQNNAGVPCTRTHFIKYLGKYKVKGGWAQLNGVCGIGKLPSCASHRIFLFLTWRSRGSYYQAQSYGESRGVLLGFARSTTLV